MWQYLVAPLAVIALLAVPKKTSQIKKNGTSKRGGEELCTNDSSLGSCSSVEDRPAPREVELRPIIAGDERDCSDAEEDGQGDGPFDGDQEERVEPARSRSIGASPPSVTGDPDQIHDA